MKSNDPLCLKFGSKYFNRNYRRLLKKAKIKIINISLIFMAKTLFAWFIWLFMSLLPGVIQFALTQVFPVSQILTDFLNLTKLGFCFGLLTCFIFVIRSK
jgi:hypothetical protein